MLLALLAAEFFPGICSAPGKRLENSDCRRFSEKSKHGSINKLPEHVFYFLNVHS